MGWWAGCCIEIKKGSGESFMYVRLNLATKPLISERRFMVFATALGLLGGVLFLALGWQYYQLRKSDAEMHASSQALQTEMQRVTAQRQELEHFFAQQENAGLQERAKFTMSVIEARSFNWTEMFMDLERTLPPGVHVVRIEPKLDKGTVSVKFTVGASTEEAKFKMLQAFENSKSFSQVELMGEKTGSQPGQDPLTVEFTAMYKTI
jgi:Tfp pilus assembly protein PilN